MARGAGGQPAALSDPTVEPAPVSNAGKVFAVALLATLGWAVVPGAEAQAPIRFGASLSQTGPLAPFGQSTLRGYQL